MNSDRSERQVLLNSGDSARRAGRRPWRLTWIGLGSGLAILITVIMIDQSTPVNTRDAEAPIVDLIGPSDLSSQSTDSIAGMLDPRMGLELPRGGWIQVANDEGRLAQQYRCEHLDPQPAELDAYWIAMEQPEVELYMSQNRLVTLSGESALAYAPHRALEEGQFNGNVRIAMYDPVDGEAADPRVNEPSMVIRTPRATFDNFLGKITCDGRIELETAREEMAGRDLQILLNDQDQRIEYLQMAKLEYLIIHSPRPLETARNSRRIHMASWKAPERAEPEGSPETDFYKLTLHGGVQIRQGDGPVARTAVGDQMHVTFSLKSEELNTSTNADQAPPPVTTANLTLPMLAPALALGIPQTTSVDDILVNCGGMVTMSPLLNPEDHLEDPRDAQLDLVGSPVLIEDPDRRLRISCPVVQYHTMARRFDLLGDDTMGVDLLTDRFQASGTWMWASPENGKAGFINPGTIEVVENSPLAMAVTADGTTSPTGTAADSLLQKVEPSAVELKLTWQGGVDIEFDPDNPNDPASGANGDPALRSILFRDEVAVDAQDGTIECGSLKMQFTRSADGQSEPERMVALEDVRARNDDQTLWTDQLIVTMESAPATQEAPPAASDDLLGGKVNVKDFLATGDVQVLLADGGRAFADRLEGDARQEVAILTGDNVTVARKEMLIDHGTRLVISRLEGTAKWAGPGQARLLRKALDVSADRRITRPAVPAASPAGSENQARGGTKGNGPVTMRARWNDEMVYDSRFNEGAGSINLKGDVAVIADGSPLERSTMDGAALTLQFAFAPESIPSTGSRSTADPLDISGIEGDSRVLEKLIAKGDARLEHREWIEPDRSDLPRVFYIAAKHITWDDLQVRAEVIGDGNLVLREPATTEAATASAGPFSGPGTSRFVWTNRLKMKRQPSNRFEIEMVGDVEGLYRGATDDDIATITAQRVDALTKRSRESKSSSTTNPLDFEGDMEIEKLRAEGQVYLATRSRRADANIVDYDTRTQIATLIAREGRKVSVVTEGSPLPVKATKMIWNMDPNVDSIQLVEPSGTGIR
ncbi:MAG: hypothetical protein CMJ39_04855 [Phycisphaerae bacterium]|nr:hypothetical protein [Phycisphaerae bacterium]